MNKKFFIAINLLILTSLFFWAKPTKAEDVLGCCGIDVNGGTKYLTITQQACKNYGDADPLNKYQPSFDASKKASADGTSCVDNLGASLPKFSNPIANPQLAVSIPGFLKFNSITCEANPDISTAQICTVPWLSDYIIGLYKYGITALIILAVIVMMIAGVMWVTAGGEAKRIDDAKNLIGGSLLGVLIAVSSYMILNILNPALTELSPLKISSPGKKDLDAEILEIDSLSPGNRDTTACPEGVTNIQALSEYYTKTKTLQYSQPQRGTCSGDTCYCDCSWFSDHLGRCANLPQVSGEGTSAGLFGNSKKIKITKSDCDNPSLRAGDIIVWRNKENTKGHVLTYIGNNKMIECGGGSYGSAIIEKSGRVVITDWKARCSGYLLDRGAYYIKR